MKATSSRSSGANVPSNPLPFDDHPQSRVVFGLGALSRLGELTRELGGSRVLLVTDPGLEAAGHPQRAVDVLRSAGLDVHLFDKVEENPTTHHVALGVSAAQACDAEIIVAIGGGSAMDVAKGVNFIFTNGGQMADYRGHGKATRPMLPSVGVPTTAGTGSEAQSYALIADASNHQKMACGDRKAAFRVAILDPELTVTQPTMVSAVTGLDSMAHAIESFVCTKRSTLSQMYGKQAWDLLNANFETVLTRPDDLSARAAMQLGAHFAGRAIEASMLGAAHSCSNPLTAHYGLTHGVAVSMMLPSVIRFNASEVGPLYAQLAGDAERLAKRIEQVRAVAGLPANLRSCGVSASILPLLAEEADQQWTAKFNPRAVGEAEMLEIYRMASVEP